MPKTRDANAFADFDAAKIIQRKEFRQWRERHKVTADSPDKIQPDEVEIKRVENEDAERYDDLTATEKKNWRLSELCPLLAALHERIMRHVKRLEKYRRAVQKKIDSGNPSFQSKIEREQRLKRFYLLDVAAAVEYLLVAEKHFWQDSEQKLQFLYRNRFGERLRQAREHAGLSRKEFAAACNITTNALHYYERGQREPSLTSLKRFARTLNTSTDSLLQ